MAFTRMNGTTYVLQGFVATSSGIVHEPVGSLDPLVFVRHWKDVGVNVRGIPDVATAGLFVIAWVSWLAWLEKKGGTHPRNAHHM